MAGQQRPIGSAPTPRDPKTEKVRDQLPSGNPFAKKYGSKGTEQK